MMRLVYREETDECHKLHGRYVREYRLPELHHLSVDGFCAQTKTAYEFNGCCWYGHTCQSFRYVPTAAGDTLAERY
jgi:G:T-mismatch repair DNA endonuclease (very short patch repair protein)